MLLIDAYNVLLTPGVLPLGLAGVDLPGLAHLIERSRYRKRAVVMVCDGRSKSLSEKDLHIGSARVVYAGAGRDADSVIERMLAEDSAPRRLLVVSSDRRVARAANRAGAGTLTSAAFLQQLSADHTKRQPEPLPAWVRQIPLEHDAVAHWFQEFGLPPPVRRPPEQARPAPSRAKAPPVMPTPTQSAAPTSDRPPAKLDLPPPGRFEITDPVLLKALQEWGGKLNLDDLDMSRWIGPPSQPHP